MEHTPGWGGRRGASGSWSERTSDWGGPNPFRASPPHPQPRSSHTYALPSTAALVCSLYDFRCRTPSHLPLTPPTLFRQMALGQLGCTSPPPHTHTHLHTSPHSPLVQLLQFRQMALRPLGAQLPRGHARHNNACKREERGGRGTCGRAKRRQTQQRPHPQP